MASIRFPVMSALVVVCMSGLVSGKPVPLDSARANAALKAFGRPGTSTADWLVERSGDSAVLIAQGREQGKVPWSDDLAADTARRDWPPRLDLSRLGLEDLRRWTAPPSGMVLRAGGGSGMSSGTTAITLASFDGEIRGGWNGWVSGGGGVRWTNILWSPSTTVATGEASSRSSWDGMLSLCGPVLCVEFERHSLPVGPDTWMQSDLDTLLASGRTGRFWKLPSDSSFDGAWERRLVARLGALEYRLRACPGLWKGTIQSLGLNDVPAGPMGWGAGVTWTRAAAATWFELASGEVRGRIPLPAHRSSMVEFEPVRLRVDFASLSRLSVSLRTALMFSDPFSPYPARIAP